MRWCAACRRYVSGHPRYCPTCGRTFSVRLCPRGHHNPRHVVFCTHCGSDNLSTPAPAEPGLDAGVHRASVIVTPFVIAGLVISTVLGTLILIDWMQLMRFLVAVGFMLGGCYWAISFLPPSVRRFVLAVGRRLFNAVRGTGDKSRQH